MKSFLVSATVALFTIFQAHDCFASSAADVETLIFVRHGEKPKGGLGQITCQGLNRSLALPQRLAKFGVPDEIFAPDPSTKVSDPDGSYYYVRPLATIEPTAIRLGMPINAHYGFTEIDKLQERLLGSEYRKSMVFVAWEHIKAEKVVKSILQSTDGDETKVPHWADSDYDSIYIVTITTDANGKRQSSFRQELQGLNDQSKACYQP